MSGAGTRETSWEVHQGNDYTVVMLPGECTENASIHVSCGDAAETEKLANLIAAAPGMLEALEALPLGSFGDDMGKHDAAEFVDNAGYFFDAMLKAKVAIQKARGQR